MGFHYLHSVFPGVKPTSTAYIRQCKIVEQKSPILSLLKCLFTRVSIFTSPVASSLHTPYNYVFLFILLLLINGCSQRALHQAAAERWPALCYLAYQCRGNEINLELLAIRFVVTQFDVISPLHWLIIK